MPKRKKLQSKNGENELCSETKARLCMYMEKGLDINDAAKLCDISPYLLSILRKDLDFEEMIERCQIKCEMSHVDNITDAGNAGLWQASTWYLERRLPHKYGKKDLIKHEYEFKLNSLLSVIFKAINELDPHIRHAVMQKLREVDIDTEVVNMHPTSNALEYAPEVKAE